ncbi:Asp23/Gls24 family envelope stress response protein [Cryptosporangium arvum]|uniref:Asp23/Gls24 family envelope stress response protein n=1 Tax=Cryptosporangium arvum TaxID=80871 RepID=UPI0004B343AA|nr:Asp23/Gls24 family envelope stress response protein [Cryptosporangium arvum]
MTESTTITPTKTNDRPGNLATRDQGLQTTQGTTSIADTVVSKIAGIAAKDVSGVYSLGGGGSRAMSAVRERIPGGRVNHSQGVSVEVGETQAAVDIDMVAEYGVAIADLASGVRRNVIASIERMTGLDVTEVNIAVADIHLPEDDEDDDTDRTPRVQ